MKALLYDKTGKEKSKIELPKVFETKIRPDIVLKYFEAEKFILMQPTAPDPRAGRKHSASGTISHKRHDWKGHYGRGISRIPRKTMWRRGTQFYWIGAEISGTRGGRRAHPPKLIKKLRKINKKEMQLAIDSALASTASPRYILERYGTIEKINEAPFVIESLPQKTKELIKVLETIFPKGFPILKNKKVRAGKGKLRGRKYKSNAGILILTSKEEKAITKGIDTKPIGEISIAELYPLGRLTLFTKKAIEELGGKP